MKYKRPLKENLYRPFFFPLITLISLIIFFDQSHTTLIDETFINQKRIYQATISERPKIKEQSTQVILNNLKTEEKIFPKKVRLSFRTGDRNFKQGDQITFESKWKKPRSYKNPGSFNYEKYLYRKGVLLTGFSYKEPQIIKKAEKNFWEAWKQSHRKKVRDSLKNEPQVIQAIFPALLWGNRDSLSHETEELFRKTGLSHLLVISGLHFAILSFLIFQSIKRAISLFPQLLLKVNLQKLTAGLTLIFILIYSLFCETSPSILRATLMISLFLISLMSRKKWDLINLYYFCAFIILCFRPYDLFSLSFQFSFLAVFALICFLPYVEEGLFKVKATQKKSLLEKLIQNLARLFLASFCIFIYLSPLSAYHFQHIQWISPFSNLLFLPLFEFILAPLILFSFLTSLFFDTAFFFKISSEAFQIFIYLLEKYESFFNTTAWIQLPSLLFISLIYVFLFLTPFQFQYKKSLLGLIFTVLIILYLPWETKDYDIKITQIDVGQGDATLISTKDNKHILIDGGGSRFFNFGRHVLFPFLSKQRIKNLDLVIITHQDSDHYLGISELLELFPIKEVYWNGFDTSDETFQSLKRKIKNKNHILHSGQHFQIGESKWDVLSPFKTERLEDDNNRSLTIKLSTKNHTALFTGDIEKEKEKQLIQEFGDELQSTFLKVPHHGSKSSSNLNFIRTVNPKLAGVSMGYKNRFYHPHPTTLKRYEDEKIPLFRTDTSGALEYKFYKDRIEVRHYKNWKWELTDIIKLP